MTRATSVMTRRRGSRFQSSDALRIFPTFVWKAELRPELYEPINEAILQELGEIGAPLAGLAPGESWQSGHNLHEVGQLGALVASIEEAAGSLLAYLEIAHEGFEITGCWANVNAPGARHTVHNHPNNYLSGVYYVRTQRGADTINFLDPRPQTATIRPPVTGLTAENTEQVVVRVKDGVLLMFPAWLPHSVDPNRSGQVRISVGFNIMFLQYTELMAKPLWTPGRRRSI
jgi:uncharacterized protein (TIGR02466 family)